jgi:hypothetical protein
MLDFLNRIQKLDFGSPPPERNKIEPRRERRRKLKEATKKSAQIRKAG